MAERRRIIDLDLQLKREELEQLGQILNEKRRQLKTLETIQLQLHRKMWKWRTMISALTEKVDNLKKEIRKREAELRESSSNYECSDICTIAV
jgi:K+/H+ antiporter YhaU regulatory subunit KhtT